MTYIASDPKQVKSKADKKQLREDQQEGDLKWLLDQPQFRRFLWSLIHERCQILRSAASGDAGTQNRDLGRQSVGLELWTLIEAVDPKLIPRMMIEYSESVT